MKSGERSVVDPAPPRDPTSATSPTRMSCPRADGLRSHHKQVARRFTEQIPHLAFLVSKESHARALNGDGLDVAADRGLVAGEVGELVGEHLEPCFVRDDNAGDHRDHSSFRGGSLQPVG